MTSTKKNNGFAKWLKESKEILAVLMANSSKTIGIKTLLTLNPKI